MLLVFLAFLFYVFQDFDLCLGRCVMEIFHEFHRSGTPGKLGSTYIVLVPIKEGVVSLKDY